MIKRLDEAFPNDAAAKALADAAEVKARGAPYRFLLTDKGEVCVQEGVVIGAASDVRADAK